jgi:hypothetical protein
VELLVNIGEAGESFISAKMGFAFVIISVSLLMGLRAYIQKPGRIEKVHAWKYSDAKSAKFYRGFLCFLIVCTVLHMILTVIRRTME